MALDEATLGEVRLQMLQGNLVVLDYLDLLLGGTCPWQKPLVRLSTLVPGDRQHCCFHLENGMGSGHCYSHPSFHLLPILDHVPSSSSRCLRQGQGELH